MAKSSKRGQWSGRVAAFERSGESRRTWCAARGLKVSTLDYWRYRLPEVSEPTRRSAPTRKRRGTDVKRRPAAAATALGSKRSLALRFVPLRVKAPSAATRLAMTSAGDGGEISLHAADGLRLELPRDIDAAWLALLLRGLR